MQAYRRLTSFDAEYGSLSSPLSAVRALFCFQERIGVRLLNRGVSQAGAKVGISEYLDYADVCLLVV